MTPEQIRAKYWSMRNKMQQPGFITPTLDREIALLQAEFMAEIAAKQAETNELLQRIALLNFEKLGVQLELFLDAHVEEPT